MSTTTTTRADHLKWCKDRAMEYVKVGDMQGAFSSFQSDMRRHTETENHSALMLMAMLMMNGQLNTAHEMEKFIKGFN